MLHPRNTPSHLCIASHNHVMLYLRNTLVAISLHIVLHLRYDRQVDRQPKRLSFALRDEGVGVGGTGPDHSPFAVTVGLVKNFFYFLKLTKPFLSHQNVLCMFAATASDVMRT